MSKKDEGFLSALLYIIIDSILRHRQKKQEEYEYTSLGYDPSKIKIKKIK